MIMDRTKLKKVKQYFCSLLLLECSRQACWCVDGRFVFGLADCPIEMDRVDASLDAPKMAFD